MTLIQKLQGAPHFDGEGRCPGQRPEEPPLPCPSKATVLLHPTPPLSLPYPAAEASLHSQWMNPNVLEQLPARRWGGGDRERKRHVVELSPLPHT